MQGLYKLGARKFGIISVAPIGCCPHARVSNTSGVCREELNKLAQSFFISLEDLLLKMSSKLKGMKYSLGNAYAMTMSIIEDPLAFGKYFRQIVKWRSSCWNFFVLIREKFVELLARFQGHPISLLWKWTVKCSNPMHAFLKPQPVCESEWVFVLGLVSSNWICFPTSSTYPLWRREKICGTHEFQSVGGYSCLRFVAPMNFLISFS